MNANDSAGDQSATPDKQGCSTVATIGFILCRIVVPAWLLAGAIFKLAELNPNLLPPPVLSTSSWIGSLLGQDPVSWLDFSMRLIIGTEIMLAGFMFFVPRLARAIAIAVLSLFVVILVTLMVQGYDADKGLASLFSGQCGCFGSAGPPPSMMLLIDGLLLLGVLFFGSGCRKGAGAFLPPAVIIPSIIVGFGIAFLVPDRTVDMTGGEPTPVVEGGKPAVDEQGWPLAPDQLDGYYFPQFGDWNGKTLSTIPFAQLLPRPLPEGFNEGDWLLVYYRADCEHCQEMFLTHFSDSELATPTLAIGIPDYVPEAALEFLCDACEITELPGVPPEYVVQTPVIVRVQDGVVTCTADGSADEDQLEACIYGTSQE
jgi:cytochrome c oxidase subunit IV